METSSFSAADCAAALLDLFLPRRCIACGRALALHERHLCIYCWADLPRTGFAFCPRNGMSERFNALLMRDTEGYEPYVRCAALFFYRHEGGYSRITQRLKYHADLSSGRFFAALLGKELAAAPWFRDVDLVVPVPLHPLRRLSRGYNQAAVIASEVAEALGARMQAGLLVRRRRTASQTHLSPLERAANVRSAFRLRKGKVPPAAHLLLVDDVFTTGATLYACYRALRSAYGPEVRISIATLACVGT